MVCSACADAGMCDVPARPDDPCQKSSPKPVSRSASSNLHGCAVDRQTCTQFDHRLPSRCIAQHSNHSELEFGPEWIAHSARPREINEFGRRQADCSVRVYEIAMLFPVLARGGHHCDDNDKFCQHFNCGGRLRRQMYTFFLLLRCCTPTWKHEQAG
jgi:hypothetical protein